MNASRNINFLHKFFEVRSEVFAELPDATLEEWSRQVATPGYQLTQAQAAFLTNPSPMLVHGGPSDVRLSLHRTSTAISRAVDAQLRRCKRRDEKNRYAHTAGYHDGRRVPTCWQCKGRGDL